MNVQFMHAGQAFEVDVEACTHSNTAVKLPDGTHVMLEGTETWPPEITNTVIADVVQYPPDRVYNAFAV